MKTTHIRIRDLEMVLALHEEGNFTRAAQRIGISQPAFSNQLRKIERRLQIRLFERSNGGVITTACGQSFMSHAHNSIHSFHRAVNEAHESQFGERKTLRIGASSFLSKRWLELLQSVELRASHRTIIEVTGAYTFTLLDGLRRHEVDLALVTSPPPHPAITSVRVHVNSFTIVMRVEHPLAAKKSINLHDMAEYPWVFFERNVHPALYDQILRRMQAENLRAHIRHHVSQADQVPALLREISLLAWLTSDGAERVVGNGLIGVPLLDSEIRREIHLTTLADNDSPLVSEYVRSFMKRVENERGPLQLRLPMDEIRAA